MGGESATGGKSTGETPVTTDQLYAGTMVLRQRTGDEIPLPEFRANDGSYIALPEPFWNECRFELRVRSDCGSVSVSWCDERHVGTHLDPVAGQATLVERHLTAILPYGAYTIGIDGTIQDLTFSGTITTTVRGVTEVHSVMATSCSALLNFAEGTYYSQFGDDALVGNSLRAPKKTLPLPAEIVEGASYYLERGSMFSEARYVANILRQITVEGVGIGHRPVSNQCDVVSAWTEAGNGAWTVNVHGAQIVESSNPGLPVLIEDGMLLKLVADLAAVQATEGSYAFSGVFVAGGSDVTVWLHPTGNGDPRANGRTYEVCVRELGFAGTGSSQFKHLHARGATNNNGAFECWGRHRDGTESALFLNCLASHTRKHAYLTYSGHFDQCVSLFCQSSTHNQSNAHFVMTRIGGDTVPQTLQLSNCAIISRPGLSVYGDSGLLVEIQTGQQTLGVITVNKLYVNGLGGCVFGQAVPAPCTVIVNDALIERSQAIATTGLFSSGRYRVSRMRHYHLSGVGPTLTTQQTQDAEFDNLLAVVGSPQDMCGFGYLHVSGGIPTDPHRLVVTNSTIVHVRTPTTFVPVLSSFTSQGATCGEWRLDHCLFANFGIGVQLSGDVEFAPPVKRLAGNWNTWATSTSMNWWDKGYKDWTAYQLGANGWEPSDANSVSSLNGADQKVTPVFADTTGRYPLYTQISALPGGCTATFLPPDEYLGVQVVNALTAIGKFPV